MARYRGPDSKLVRNAQVSVAEIPKAAKLRRATQPSGPHGAARKKLSEYAIQLREKQKIRLTYGLQEKQFYRYFQIASKQQGVTGTVLLQLLESRLDNILFRSSLARTRRQARQLVSHGHVLVNGHRVDIPSYRMKPGDVLTVRERSKSLFKTLSEVRTFEPPHWLEVDFETLTARYALAPVREDIDRTFNEQLIIEYYSR